MKKRTKWVLLALIAVVAIILVIALLRGCQQDPGVVLDPDSGELPLDDTPLTPIDPSEIEEPTETSPKPNIDPDSGVELEEDELPIVVD